MNKPLSIPLIFFTLVLLPQTVMATEPLQMQIDRLNAQITDLEQRLQALESTGIKRAVAEEGKSDRIVERVIVYRSEEELPPENPGDWRDPANWQQLIRGMDYEDVIDLLGEPLHKRPGAFEYWFYTEQGVKGAHVKFVLRKTNSWMEPKEK